MAQLFFLSGRAWEDANGNPYPAAVAHFYVPGTTTNQDTYTSASLAVANANPVVSDSSTGIFGDIYFAAKRYKVVIKDASANTLKTWEVVDATEQLITASSAPSPTYPLLRYYNTSDGHVYRRNAADNAWIDEGLVDSLLNAATVTETLAGTETAKAVTPDSLAALWETGTDVTITTNNISLPSTGGGKFTCGTATTTLTTISSAASGREIEITFSNAHTITHGSGINTPDAANWSAPAGAIIRFRRGASDWTITNIAIPAATQSLMEARTDTLHAVTPGRQHFHPGHPKFWAYVTVSAGTPTLQQSYNVTSITDTGTGELTVTIATDFSSEQWAPFVTIERGGTAGSNYFPMVGNGGIAAGTVLARCEEESPTPVGVDPASWSIMGLGDH